jgi:ankyrin repeat protein
MRASNLNTCGDSCRATILGAARKGFKSIVHQLLKHEEKSRKSTARLAALEGAAFSGNLVIARMVLEPQFDLEIAHEGFRKVLETASEHGHAKYIYFLLSWLSDPNKRQDALKAALHIAFKKEHTILMERHFNQFPGTLSSLTFHELYLGPFPPDIRNV